VSGSILLEQVVSLENIAVQTASHKITGTGVRILIFLLVSGFVCGNSCLNISNTTLLHGDHADLAQVIRSMQSFSRVDSAEDASRRMRSLIFSFQAASGLLVTSQASGENEDSVVAVFYKLPLLPPSSRGAGKAACCITLGDTAWSNNYTSIRIPPPFPPPLSPC
jgi:hypothetical protein